MRLQGISPVVTSSGLCRRWRLLAALNSLAKIADSQPVFVSSYVSSVGRSASLKNCSGEIAGFELWQNAALGRQH